ncbi:MAG: RNA methyltransferase [Lachnospiraceae bacterium]|nr:RNA methyltransferase [Lachnospiraceae bacterium]
MSNIIEIVDFQAPELDVYARFTEAQLLHINEPEQGIFIAESPKVIERALDAGCIPVSILMERKHIETQGADIIKRCGKVPIFTAEFDVLTRLTGFKLTRGMLCAMYRPKLPGVKEICENARRIAILENVENPTNVGAIFRSAAALNMDAVLLTSGCSDPLYRRAVRVSMGTVFQIPWTFINALNLNMDGKLFAEENDIAKGAGISRMDIEEAVWPGQGIRLLRSMGFKTAAMALGEDCININDPNLLSEDKLAIILGTEGDGLSTDTIENCDYTVCIPMSHGVDSLNVAAASAVAFWQIGQILD